MINSAQNVARRIPAVGGWPENLPVDAACRPVLLIRLPGDYEASAIQRRHGRVMLRAARMGIDPELAACLGAVGIVALAGNRKEGAVLSEGFPDDNEAAVRKPRNHGVLLRCRPKSVGLEFGPREGAGLEVVAPANDGILVPVPAVIRLPSDNEAPILERRHRRIPLAAARAGIHLGIRSDPAPVLLVSLKIDAVASPA